MYKIIVAHVQFDLGTPHLNIFDNHFYFISNIFLITLSNRELQKDDIWVVSYLSDHPLKPVLWDGITIKIMNLQKIMNYLLILLYYTQ